MQQEAVKSEALPPKVQRIETLKNFVGKFLYAFIVLNILIICLETVDVLNYLDPYFDFFEVFAIIVFSVEYGIRLAWAYSQNRMFSYMFSILGIIDLVSILPFYLPQYNSGNFRFLK